MYLNELEADIEGAIKDQRFEEQQGFLTDVGGDGKKLEMSKNEIELSDLHDL